MRAETCKDVEMLKEELKLERAVWEEAVGYLRHGVNDQVTPVTLCILVADCFAKAVPESKIQEVVNEIELKIKGIVERIEALDNTPIAETKDDKKKPNQSEQTAKPGQIIKQKGPSIVPRGPKSQIQSAG